MGRIFGRIIMTLCCTILLASSVQAKTLKEVYLRDGGIIECQNVWQANGKVMVLVNRDTLLDLSRSDVDLKKTFGKKPAKTVRKTKIARKVASKPAAAMPQAVHEPSAKEVVPQAAEQKPATPPKPAVKPASPAAKAAPPAPKQPVSAGTKTAPQAAKQTTAEAVKPPPPATKQQPAPAVKPAAPATAKSPQADKTAVQQSATSAKKPLPGAETATPGQPRANLALAKPATPPAAEKSLLSGNMTNIALAGLLVLLVGLYVVYKKKQKG